MIKNSELISQLLFHFKNKISQNLNNIKLLNFYRNKIKVLCNKIEYLEIRSSKDLSKKISKNNFKIFIAYRQSKVRLIDNV